MRRFACICAVLALPVTAAPAPAGAADVERQVERRAPSRYPENIPGCGRSRCVRGETIHRGHVLLSRRVRLDRGERRVGVTFRCPSGRVFRTFGFLESGEVLFQIPESQLPYTRRTRVRVTAERKLAPLRTVARGTLYAVCVPR